MFDEKEPSLNVDNGGENDWFDEPVEQPSVDDEQPKADSETGTEEGGNDSEPAEDDAEGGATDDADDAGEDDPDAENKEGEKDNQPLNDDTEIDMGEGRQPVTLRELKQGYLRQSDYTRKTQALAEERKAFEAERQSMEPVKQLSDFLTQNPYLREQIQMFIKEFTQAGYVPLDEALQDAKFGPYINALMAQNQQLQKELNEIRTKYGELEFAGSMRDLKHQLKAEYGELATDDYLNALEERAKNEHLPISVLKEIADAHLTKQKLEKEAQESKKAAKEAETKTYQKLREKSGSAPPQPKRTGQVPSKPGRNDPFAPIGWDEIFS